VHGKVVDFITHTIDDGTLYFTVRFTDKTSFCLRYACDMLVVSADLTSAEAERDAAIALERAIYGDLFPVVPNIENRNNFAALN